MRESSSAPIPRSFMASAHLETVALLHPSAWAVSFQLAPFASSSITSFLVAMQASSLRMETPPIGISLEKRLSAGSWYPIVGMPVLGRWKRGTN